MKIFKYTIKVSERYELEIPNGGEILSIQNQYDEITIWVMVNEAASKEVRTFAVFGAGHPVDFGCSPSVFIGTVQIDGLAWHVFEIK